MTDTKRYQKGEIIFAEGDPGSCMYDLLRGRVGIYAAYGAENEKLLTELKAGTAFGEMAMVEGVPRSAFAVALEDGTEAAVVTWETLGSYFRERPSRVVVIMQQMSRRIRELTRDYLDACGAVTELTKQLEQGKKAEENAWIEQRMRRYLDAYRASGSYGGSFSGRV